MIDWLIINSNNFLVSFFVSIISIPIGYYYTTYLDKRRNINLVDSKGGIYQNVNVHYYAINTSKDKKSTDDNGALILIVLALVIGTVVYFKYREMFFLIVLGCSIFIAIINVMFISRYNYNLKNGIKKHLIISCLISFYSVLSVFLVNNPLYVSDISKAMIQSINIKESIMSNGIKGITELMYYTLGYVSLLLIVFFNFTLLIYVFYLYSNKRNFRWNWIYNLYLRLSIIYTRNTWIIVMILIVILNFLLLSGYAVKFLNRI